MKINFAAPILGIDGLTHVPKAEGSDDPFLLSDVAVTALLNAPNAQTAQEKVHRAMLAEAAFKKEDVDLSPEDLIIIRDCIAAVYGPLVVYRSFQLLGGMPKSGLKAVS